MISVLTGDIVDSQKLENRERSKLSSALREAANYAQLGESFEVFGGDSWQALCQPPQTVFVRSLVFRSYLQGIKGIDTRISIGIGSYESIRPQKISLSQGEAFVLSGQGLKSISADRRLAIHTTEALPIATRQLLDAATTLLDGITSNWTSKQAQAIALASTEAANIELAKKFNPPISAQAFGKHLASAQWKLVKQALQYISQALSQSAPSP
ncbi:hypothetical protein VDG1235_1647 [Verrucomicrobiia bacterium DG1235]|nr:hypothetical protein VDG1235_1647 [Verrucomicrobiae bacterium DG1235]